jgi:hypothetical protein
MEDMRWRPAAAAAAAASAAVATALLLLLLCAQLGISVLQLDLLTPEVVAEAAKVRCFVLFAFFILEAVCGKGEVSSAFY